MMVRPPQSPELNSKFGGASCSINLSYSRRKACVWAEEVRGEHLKGCWLLCSTCFFSIMTINLFLDALESVLSDLPGVLIFSIFYPQLDIQKDCITHQCNFFLEIHCVTRLLFIIYVFKHSEGSTFITKLFTAHTHTLYLFD